MMEIITKVKEVVVVPNGDGISISIFKADEIVDEAGAVLGYGAKGEYVDAFDLLSTQVSSLIQFLASTFGKSIPKDQELASLNVQNVNDSYCISVATVKPLLDQEGNRLGTTGFHRTVLELSSKQMKSLTDFIEKDLQVLQADVMIALEKEAEALANQPEEEQVQEGS